MEILYEDKNILICKKIPGTLCQETPDGTGLADEVKNAYGYAGIVHRLDQNVGGAIIFGKNKEFAGKLSGLVSENKIRKTYLAVVEGCPKEEKGRYEDLLFKDSSKNKSYVVKRERKGVKRAILEYEVLSSGQYREKNISLVKIVLHTGRTHQIRVQFSSRKMPLLGDGKYGSKVNLPFIALWSHSLDFESPVDGERIFVSSVPDKNMIPWSTFADILT